VGGAILKSATVKKAGEEKAISARSVILKKGTRAKEKGLTQKRSLLLSGKKSVDK